MNNNVIPSLDFQFEQLRKELTFEADLIARRTSWFIAAQAFFFASLAIGIDPGNETHTLGSSLYFPLIPILSIIVCGLTILSVHAAATTAAVYRDRLNAFVDENQSYANLWRKPSRPVFRLGLLSTQVLPYVFLLAWLYILLIKMFMI